jgi:hypothetical protein
MSSSQPRPYPTASGSLPNLNYGYLYGENEDLDHLRGTGRSGLSPRYWPEVSFPTEDAVRQWVSERSYQRIWLDGYTSSTLHAMGALDKPDVKPASLDNQVHPVFDRRMWATYGTIPLGHGLEGNYTAQDDLIWYAMLPSLRLASKLVENAHCWPW